jgi:hypothetical protein
MRKIIIIAMLLIFTLPLTIFANEENITLTSDHPLYSIAILLEEKDKRIAELTSMLEDERNLRIKGEDKISELERKVAEIDSSLNPLPIEEDISEEPIKENVVEEPIETKGDKIINLGLTYIGTPYKFGAKSGDTSVFDCSSFTQWVYYKNGITLPRDSRQQSKVGITVSKADIKKGDLVFFDTSKDGVIDHVSIYMGDNKLLHSSPSGDGVNIQEVTSFWRSTAVVIKRVIE